MTKKTIIAGAFIIEAAVPELTEALSVALGIEEEEGPSPFLDVRCLRADVEDELPPLFALALPTEVGPVWILRGMDDVAQIRIKNKQAKDPKKILKPLVAWAETFSLSAAINLVTGAYGLDMDGGLDDSIHLIVDLPLDGIDPHRVDDLDQWLDDLTETVEAALDRVDADGEAVLFDSSDETRTSLSGHFSVLADDDEDAIKLVREALLEAFAGFTPFSEVCERLSVEIETECMYDMFADILAGVDDQDLPD